MSEWVSGCVSEEQVSLVLILLLCSPILHAQRACAGDSEYDRDFTDRVFKVRPQSNLHYLRVYLLRTKLEYEFIRAYTATKYFLPTSTTYYRVFKVCGFDAHSVMLPPEVREHVSK